MFEKNMSIGFLLDFYGDILTERKKEVIEMYYNEDMSLAEISEVLNISRQGVRDIIKKTETELQFYEEKLGLAQRFEELKNVSDRLSQLSADHNVSEEIKEEIRKISVLVR